MDHSTKLYLALAKSGKGGNAHFSEEGVYHISRDHHSSTHPAESTRSLLHGMLRQENTENEIYVLKDKKHNIINMLNTYLTLNTLINFS